MCFCSGREGGQIRLRKINTAARSTTIENAIEAIAGLDSRDRRKVLCPSRASVTSAAEEKRFAGSRSRHLRMVEFQCSSSSGTTLVGGNGDFARRFRVSVHEDSSRNGRSPVTISYKTRP